MNRAVILFALACTAAGAMAADKPVYKWTDANGVVHFTDAPPPKDTQNVQSLHLVGGTASETPASDDKPKDAAAGPASPSGTNAAANTPMNDAAACKQARANLELLQGKTPVGIAGADGKPQALDDKARETQIGNAKLAIARFCK